MSGQVPERRALPGWVWIVLGTLALAAVLVWTLPSLLGDDGDPTAGPTTPPPTTEGPVPTTDPTDDPGPTQDPTQDPGPTTDPTQDTDDGILQVTEDAGSAGFDPGTTALWVNLAPPGFEVGGTDGGLFLESTPGCSLSLYGDPWTGTAADDAAATQEQTAAVTANLSEINDDLQVLDPPGSWLLPVGEEGEGGQVELIRSTVEYVSGDAGVLTQTSTLTRSFHDLGKTISLTYTCPSADIEIPFDEILEFSQLWVSQ